MYKQKNFIYLLTFTLLLFSSKWITTYFFEFNESFITKIIFDTIRYDYFLNIFKNVKVIKNQDKTMHKSKRILCSQFLD